MSFGKNHQSSSGTQQATSQQTLDPTIMSWLGSNYQHAQNLANTPYQPFTGEMVAGLNPTQHQALGLFGNIAASNPGGGLLNNAATAAQSVAGYHPTSVTSTGYTPTSAAATTANASNINRGDIQNVNGGWLGNVDLSQYMNPYESSVISGLQGDMERQRQQEQTYNQGRATAAGAFGGSRDALVAAETNRDLNTTMANTIANLRMQGYTNAQANAEADLARQLQANLANQGQDASVASQNANAQTATSQFNAGQTNQMAAQNAGAANTASSQQSAQALQAALANQSSGVAAQGLNLQGAGLLGNLSDQELQHALTQASALGQAGSIEQQNQQAHDDALYQQYLQQQQYPLQMQALLNAALGLAGNPTLGSSQSTGTTNSSGTGWNISVPIK